MDTFSLWYIAILAFYAGSVESYLKEPCRDEISVDTCWYFRRRGFCKKSPETLRKVCSKTCGFCQSCEDAYIKPKCEELKSLGGCLINPIKMKHICAATCGFCPKICIDHSPRCKHLSNHRACYEFRYRMEKMCPATCGYCRPSTPCDNHVCPVGFRCQLTKNRQPYCECDVKCDESTMAGPVCAKNGETYSNLCSLKKAECKTLSFIAVDFFGDCNSVTLACQDERREKEAGLCPKWKAMGACRDHAALMEVYCKRTCGYCRVPGSPPRPKCLQSKYGCCWNGEDISKQNKYGKGCAPCADLKLCKFFKMYCNSKISNKFMKDKCPLTCGYCSLFEANAPFQSPHLCYITNCSTAWCNHSQFVSEWKFYQTGTLQCLDDFSSQFPEHIQRLQEKQWIIQRKRRHFVEQNEQRLEESIYKGNG